MTITQLHGDTTEQQRALEAGSAQMVVTSPPYWRMRRYTSDPREIGQEETYQAYVSALVAVFAESWRVLDDRGTLWLNIGDCYNGGGPHHGNKNLGKSGTNRGSASGADRRITGLPTKSLLGIPWRVAFALQEYGWILRSEIIWEKPNGMPESVDDRPTTAHEHIFLFAKQGDYFYDADAIREPHKESSLKRVKTGLNTNRQRDFPGSAQTLKMGEGQQMCHPLGRNARTIWRVNTRGIPDEHYAAFPDELARRCILAGSRPGDTVLDPFAGSGTTLRVAETLGRNSIGIDLGYQELQAKRTNNLQMTIEAYL